MVIIRLIKERRDPYLSLSAPVFLACTYQISEINSLNWLFYILISNTISYIIKHINIRIIKVFTLD